MNNKKYVFPVLVYFLSPVVLADDLSGDWEITSSVGGNVPITVNCTILQEGSELSGICTPVMDNAEPAEFSGNTDDISAEWGYEVVFNGNPGTVNFSADEISESEMSGTLDLSGQIAPFTASRKE